MNNDDEAIQHARQFLQALDATTDGEYTFQTFDDDAERRSGSLAKVLHGTLDQHLSELLDLNQRGAGIFVATQSTDLVGRSTENIVRVRNVFADDDTARDDVRDDVPLLPHIITESSRGKYHYYWNVSDCPLEDFKGMQRTIAAVLGTDPAVNDLPRVMRIPGFMHRKGAAFISRLIAVHEFEPYPVERLRAEFGALLLEMPQIEQQPQNAPRGTLSPAQVTNVLPAIASGAVELVDGERHETYKQMAFKMRAQGLGASAIAAQLHDVDRANPIKDGATYIPSISNWTAKTFPAGYNGANVALVPGVEAIAASAPQIGVVEEEHPDPPKVSDHSLKAQVSRLLDNLGGLSGNRVAGLLRELTDLDAAHVELESFRFEGPAGEGQDMIRDTRHRATYRPGLGTVSMFLLMATALGRIYKSPTGVRSNMYMAGLAGSGTGKQHAADVAMDVLEQAGCGDFIMSSEFGSSQIVQELLGEQPNRVCISNELGQELASRSDKAGNGAGQAINRMISNLLLNMWSLSNKPTYMGAVAAHQKKSRHSKYPCWTWGGFSVPDIFLASLNSGKVVEGFFPRLFVVVDKKKQRAKKGSIDTKHKAVAYTGPPPALVALVRRLRDISAPGQDLAHVAGNDLDIPAVIRSFEWDTEDCSELYDQLDDIVDVIVETPRHEIPDSWGMLISRAPEQVQKLAMCITASRTSGHGLEITTDDLTKALRLFLAMSTTAAYLVDSHMADSDREREVKKMKRLIETADNGRLMWAEIGRKMGSISAKERKEYAADLVSFYDFFWATEVIAKKSRPGKYLCCGSAKLGSNLRYNKELTDSFLH